MNRLINCRTGLSLIFIISLAMLYTPVIFAELLTDSEQNGSGHIENELKPVAVDNENNAAIPVYEANETTKDKSSEVRTDPDQKPFSPTEPNDDNSSADWFGETDSESVDSVKVESENPVSEDHCLSDLPVFSPDSNSSKGSSGEDMDQLSKFYQEKAEMVSDEILTEAILLMETAEKTPIIISTYTAFDAIRDNLGGHYELAGDIVIEGPWSPIGCQDSAFSGTLDGRGYSIFNLVIDTYNDYSGLFGYIKNAVIKNINLEQAEINGKKYTGGITGFAMDSLIDNSSVTGTINGEQLVGGLVGQSSNTKITGSFSECVIDGGNMVGGLVGYMWSSSRLTDSYALGEIDGENNVGGLAGRVWSSSKITNCYAAAKITGSGADVGGLTGFAHSSAVAASTGNFWDTDVSLQGDSALGTGKSTVEMKNRMTYEEPGLNWDFFATWSIDDGKAYPVLQWQQNANEPEEGGPGIGPRLPGYYTPRFAPSLQKPLIVSPSLDSFFLSQTLRYLEEAERIISAILAGEKPLTPEKIEMAGIFYSRAKSALLLCVDPLNADVISSIQERLELLSEKMLALEALLS